VHHRGVAPPEVADARLVAGARAGEVEALAVLLERYRPSLYAAALALVRDRDAAADLVQETYAVAVARLAGLRDPDAVGGWLHAVLRNAARMQLRRAPSCAGHPPPGSRTPTAPTPSSTPSARRPSRAPSRPWSAWRCGTGSGRRWTPWRRRSGSP
jgi:DNA-directed RNA polymerase specialized sigma24 family protein